MEEDQVSQSDDSQFNILSVSVTFRQHTTGDEHQEEGEEVTVDIINNNNNNNNDDDDSNISRTAIEQDECCPPNPPAISTDKCCVGTKSGGEKEEGSTKETEVLKVCKLHGLSLITR